MARRDPAVDDCCATYVLLMERGHSLDEVAERFGLQRNAVYEALLRRGMPTSMKQAVRAYWQRQEAAEPATAEG